MRLIAPRMACGRPDGGPPAPWLDGILGDRPVIAAAMALVAVAIAAIWVRVPYVPAPSGGDEVWWGEGAYWLLKEGRLRWDWMANPQGMEILTFWPPTVALFQAGFFWLLGLNAFSLCATSALACTAMILLMIVCARRQGGGVALGCVLGFLPFALFSVERRFMQVRMEPWMAVFAIASLNLLWDASVRDGRRAMWAAFLGGLCAAVAALSYYPLAPFVAAGLLASVMFGLRRQGAARWWRESVAFGSGCAMVGLLFGLWVSRDPGLFQRQVLGGESGAYINPAWASGVLLGPLRHPGSPWTPMIVETILGGLFGLGAFIYGPAGARMYGLATAVTSLAFVASSLPDRMSPVGALAAATAIAWICAMRGKARPLGMGVAVFLSCLGFARIMLVAGTAWIQSEGRDYARVGSWLRDMVGMEAPVMTNNVGWLALRESRGPGKLIRLSDALDFSHAFRSTAQRTVSGISGFRYYIIGESPGEGPLKCPSSPAIEEGIAEGWIIERGRFRSPWRPLPWARRDPYGIIVLENIRFERRA